MKSLIILAHPSQKSFNHAIAHVYKDASQDSEIIDLYDQEWKQDFLSFEDIKEISKDPIRDRFQKKITDAKEITLVFPLWWGFAPAILKNFIDNNFTTGFAFEYKDGKPQGLLSNKKFNIFVTCDAPSWMYYATLLPFKTILSLMTFRFCGMKLRHFSLFGNTRASSKEKREKFLKKVSEVAKKD